jgi:hypothetical protein
MLMIKNLLTLFLLLGVIQTTAAEDSIDLGCEKLAGQMVKRLASENLLVDSTQAVERAQAITLGLCAGAQEAAQQQHETGKQDAITDWIWQSRPETQGHKRLKKF